MKTPKTYLKAGIRRVLPVATVLVLCTSGIASAQESAPSEERGNRVSTLINRYGELNVERSPASIDTELAQKHYRRGSTYSNLERYEEAIEEYRLSIIADPNFSESIRNLANIYYHLERYDEAIPLFARFVRLERAPTAPRIAALGVLGELYRRAERYDDAIEVDLQYIEANPSAESEVHLMANAYNNAGESEYAIRIYEAAAEFNPDQAFTHRTLGRLYEDQGRLEDALEQYEKAAELDPESDFYRQLVETTRNKL